MSWRLARERMRMRQEGKIAAAVVVVVEAGL